MKILVNVDINGRSTQVQLNAGTTVKQFKDNQEIRGAFGLTREAKLSVRQNGVATGDTTTILNGDTLTVSAAAAEKARAA